MKWLFLILAVVVFIFRDALFGAEWIAITALIFFVILSSIKKENKTENPCIELRKKYNLDQEQQIAPIPFDDFFKWNQIDNKLFLGYFPPVEGLSCIYEYYPTDTWREYDRALKANEKIECCKLSCDLGIKSLKFEIEAPQQGLFVHNLPTQVSPLGLGTSYKYALKKGDTPFYIDLDPEILQKYVDARELKKKDDDHKQLAREKEEIKNKIKEKYRKKALEEIATQELIDSGELF